MLSLQAVHPQPPIAPHACAPLGDKVGHDALTQLLPPRLGQPRLRLRPGVGVGVGASVGCGRGRECWAWAWGKRGEAMWVAGKR